MNKIILYFALFWTSVYSISISAQNENYGLGISFKALLMDYQSLNGGSFGRINDYHHGFEIGISKRLTNRLNLYVPVKIGVVNIDKFDMNKFDQGRLRHKKVYGVDAQLQYHFYTPSKKAYPFFKAGLGIVGESEGELNLQTPLGVGLQIKISDNAYAVLESEYRLSFTQGRSNFHHGLGFVYLFGGKNQVHNIMKDTDGDGISDDMDLCPEIPGLKSLNGCPDSDGDGIADINDKCPNLPGDPSSMGCPDSDGDGITDNEDECPDKVGPKSNKGCPEASLDSDGDGIPDTEDRCPNIAGTKINGGCPGGDRDHDGVLDADDRCPDQAGSTSAHGCPDKDNDGVADFMDKCPNSYGPAVYDGCPDSDGDGIHDGRDRCPHAFGTVATNGCPEISSSDKETLDIAMRAVQFDTGRSTLKSQSYSILNQIADIMLRYPSYKLVISGHTDNTGSASKNQRLSEQRAKACYEYLLQRGVEPSRLDYVGYGESRPISDNKTLKGRSLNRRVEFKLVPAN